MRVSPWLVALSLTAAAVAQTTAELPLRPPVVTEAQPATEEVIYRFRDYDEHGFNRVVQKIVVPTLTVYRPAKPAARGTALVVCPGGGYQYVTIDREGHAIGRFFAERGITVAVLKYRLPQPELKPDGLPEPQEDVLAAVKFVRERAAEWGVDPKRVGVLGFSAGGHLAGTAAVLGEAAAGTRPDFAALIYPVVCLDPPHAHQGSRTRLLGKAATPQRVAEFSLERRARAGLPPFFVAHARDDKGVPPENSELLAAALREAKVPVELLPLATGGHGFGLGRDAESARWKNAFLAWLGKLP